MELLPGAKLHRFEEDLYLTRLIEHRIASATAKFHELRKIPTNGRISARTLGRYMNAFGQIPTMYCVSPSVNLLKFLLKNNRSNG